MISCEPVNCSVRELTRELQDNLATARSGRGGAHGVGAQCSGAARGPSAPAAEAEGVRPKLA